MVRPAERADARTNRARILATAVALFAERGMDAEMRDIAERAGLAVGTVYNHFPSKDALLVAVLQQALAEVERVTERAAELPDVVAALGMFVGEGLAVAERYGALMAAISEGKLLAAQTEAIDETRRAVLGERVVQIVRRGVADGTFRPDLDAEIAAGVLWSAFLPWVLTDLRRTRTTAQIADALLAIFLDGARA
jgi:AcrR family transcriptional regulator